MAEPLPSASNAPADGAADNEDDPAVRLPKNAEDRKAAAALNSLNANEISQGESGDSAAKQPSKADQEALGKAMSRLEIASGASAAKKKDHGKKAEEKKDVEIKKKIKIAAEDVTFLVGTGRYGSQQSAGSDRCVCRSMSSILRRSKLQNCSRLMMETLSEQRRLSLHHRPKRENKRSHTMKAPSSAPSKTQWVFHHGAEPMGVASASIVPLPLLGLDRKFVRSKLCTQRSKRTSPWHSNYGGSHESCEYNRMHTHQHSTSWRDVLKEGG